MPAVPQTSAAASPSHPHFVSIRTPRLRLRTFQPRDAAAQRALDENPANIEFEPHSQPHRPAGHFEAWIARQRLAAARGESNFMVVALPGPDESRDAETGEALGDQVIGMTGFNSVHDSASGVVVDVGVMIDSPHWRRGYGREVMEGLLEFALAEAPQGWGAARIEMQTERGNVRFLALAESMGLGGLKAEGDGSWDWAFGREEWAAAKAGRK